MAPELAAYAVPIGAFLLTYLIHSTLLLVGAWSLEEVFQFESVRLRERLWRAALLGGFLTAALQTGLGLESPLARFVLSTGAVELDVVERVERSTTASLELAPADSAELATSEPGSAPSVLEPSVAGSQAVARPPVGQPRSSGSRGLGSAPVAWRLAEPESAAGGAPRSLAGLAGLGRFGALGLAAAASLAALAAALLVALSARSLGHRLAGARELTEGSAFELARELARRGRLSRPARLFVAPRLRSPLSSGLLRPAIYVPPRALAELSREELEALLAHELGHVARRDPAWLTLYWLVQQVTFFQPLNRLARRRLSSAAEVLADDWAVRHTGRQLSLASCLARIAGWVHERQRLLTAHMTHEREGGRSNPSASTLGRRIERLLDDQRRAPEPARAWWTPAACLVLGSLAFGAPGVSARTPAAAQTRPEPVSEPSPEARSEPSPTARFGALEPNEPRASELAVPSASEPAQPEPTSSRVAEPLDLGRELGALNGEMQGLERELEALREELEGFEADPAFAAALRRLETHARSLATRRDRMATLVRSNEARAPRP